MKIIEPTTRKKLTIDCSRKAPKHYGPDVYRFWHEPILLKARGWELIKQAREYTYMRAPAGVTLKPKYVIEVMIPTDDEAIEMAESAHREGVEWMGLVGEWPTGYVPEHQYKGLVEIDSKTHLPVGPAPIRTANPRFDMGLPLVWGIGIRWENGIRIFPGQEMAPPLCLYPDTIIEPAIYVGAVEKIEVNRYERDGTARRLCIEHYGTGCCVCAIDFGKLYGALAEGFIHVHHLVPLSTIGQEYQVDPIADLRPVCPNCHAVIHLRNPPLTIDEARELLRQHADADKAHKTKERTLF